MFNIISVCFLGAERLGTGQDRKLLSAKVCNSWLFNHLAEKILHSRVFGKHQLDSIFDFFFKEEREVGYVRA